MSRSPWSCSSLRRFWHFPQPERTHDITPDDYASVNTITEIAVSPDGKQVAYCLATWDKKADNRKTDLWVVDTDGKGKPKQLTSDRGNDRRPKWSADGKSVYVLANRQKKGEKHAPLDGKTHVWKVPAEGGDSVAVTQVKGGVVSFDYAPKADALFYSVDTTTTDEDDFAALRKKFANPEYGFGKRAVSEVFKLEAKEDAKPEKLIADKRYIREFAVTQDGKRVAMVSAFDDTVLKSEGESRVDIWENGKVVTPPTDGYRAKAASPHAWLENLAWSPDGTAVRLLRDLRRVPGGDNHRRAKEAMETGRMPRKTMGAMVRGYGSPLTWLLKTTRHFDHRRTERGVISPLTPLRTRPASVLIKIGRCYASSTASFAKCVVVGSGESLPG